MHEARIPRDQFEELVNRLDAIYREVHHMSTTVPAGLAALQQADTDLTAAVTSLTTSIGAAIAQIATLNSQNQASEDPAVKQNAADIETKIASIQQLITNLNTAVNPSAPASSSTSSTPTSGSTSTPAPTDSSSAASS